MSHIADKTFTYQCQDCGEIKPDSEFEQTGNSEICLKCQSKDTKFNFQAFDEWLLNNPTITQEDREIIVESLAEYLKVTA